MNNQKRIELLERRNESLARQLDKAKTELNKSKNLSNETVKRANNLIKYLEEVKENFDNALIEVYQQKEAYTELIEEMISFRNDLLNGNIPKRNIFKRIKNRYKK